jgi:cytochrome c-type biogenesis protein CcmF
VGELGRWALWMSLPAGAYLIVANAVGIWRKQAAWLESGRRAALAFALLTTIASLSLIGLLLTGDFRYEYVAEYTSRDLAWIYKIAAFWGGNAGSLLLWLWLLSLYAAFIAYMKDRESEEMRPYVLAVIALVALFFSLLLNGPAQPFAQNSQTVTDGNGLNPLLQNPGMTIHPVNLYLGYIGFTVPFAYGMAALFMKKADALWLKLTRRWTLVSWLFLSMGILFGAQWSYEELGWGGYWAWDPVENAALMPWLTATAFLHSSLLQERKGMLKGWNLILNQITFLLTLLGTFLTRSGLLWSVHAFANGEIGAFFLGFVGLVLAVSLMMVVIRWPMFRADVQMESVVSKEGSFLLNNLLLLGAAFSVFWGTLFPVVSEVVTGSKIMVGPSYFNRVNFPILIVLLILMGSGPLAAWRRSSLRQFGKRLLFPFLLLLPVTLFLWGAGVREWGALLSVSSAFFAIAAIWIEFVHGVRARQQMTNEPVHLALWKLVSRSRHRYGGYIVHLAVAVIAIGLTVSGTYKVQVDRLLQPGEELQIGAYTLQYQGMGQERGAGETSLYADVLVSKKGKKIAVLRPAERFFDNGAQTSAEVAILRSWTDDLYLVFAGRDEKKQAALIQAHVNPLVGWIWYGGYLLIGGTLISLWPESSMRRGLRSVTEVGDVPVIRM